MNQKLFVRLPTYYQRLSNTTIAGPRAWVNIKLGILSEPVLVGRKRELEELQQYLELSKEGQETIVFISGEAGSGKTRLVTDFLSSVGQNETVTTLTGWCLSDVGIAYFPFVEAFNAYFSSLNKKNCAALSKGNAIEQRLDGIKSNEELEVTSWLKGPVRTGLSGMVEISPETWKDLTFGVVRKALTSICAISTTVLFLDDIQWADSASLELLHYISRSMASEPLLVLATYRSEDLKQGENGQPHPLVEALRLMRRDTHFKEIKLSGLSLAEISLLAEHMIGGSIQSSFAQKLENESQGNPLFIVESLRMLSEKQSLVVDKDKWSLSTDYLGIPTKIKDIILLRVEKLKLEQRKILEIASVIGTKFDPEFLAIVLGKDSLEVLELLNTISQTSSLVVCEGGYYKFNHSKSRDSLYEGISPGLRKAYHSKIAEKLENNINDASKPQIGDLAYHYSHSGNKEKAIKYSLTAGEQALSFVLGTEAIKHFKYVLDNTADESGYTAEREKATEGLGDSFFVGANSEAVRVFEQLSEETNSILVKVRALRKAARASLLQGDYAHAMEIVKRPIGNTPTDRLESARFLLVKGMVEAWGAYMPDALEDLQDSLKVFEEEYSLPDIIDTLIELSVAYMERQADGSSILGQPKEALASILRALVLCEHTKNLGKQFYGLIVAFVIFNECALTKQAVELVKENTKVVQKIGDPRSRDSNEPWNRWISGFMTEVMAMDKIFSKLSVESTPAASTEKIEFDSLLPSELLNACSQDFGIAVEESLEGSKYAEEGDFFEIQGLLYGNLTREYAWLGQMDQAEVYYNKLEKVFTETTLSGFVVAKVLYLFSKAVFYSFKQQWEEANRFYGESIIYYCKVRPGTGIEAGIRKWYYCALLQQGRFIDAMKQLEESKKILEEFEKKLEHPNILAYILVPAKAEVDKEFNMRLDVINVAKNSAVLVQTKDLLPAGFKIISTKPLLNLKDSFVGMENKQINAFQDEVFTFTVKAMQPGTFTLNPQILFVDDLGQSKTCILQPGVITVDTTQPKVYALTDRPESFTSISTGLKPFAVFLCYKKSSGKDFADHLKAGLDELGLHTFLDSKDIPQIVEGEEEWTKVRDKALEESKFFVLIMTPGFNLSTEVIKELNMARKQANKVFVFFRHRNMGRKIVVNLGTESLDIGKLEQVSFETKEELLRLAHNILLSKVP